MRKPQLGAPTVDPSRTYDAKYQSPNGPKKEYAEAPLANHDLRSRLLAQEPRAMERQAKDSGYRKIELPTVTVVDWLDEFWQTNRQRWSDQRHPPTPKQIINELQAAIAAQALDTI